MAGAPGPDDDLPDDHRWFHTWLGTDRLLARRVARPVARFLEIEASSGLLLLVATLAALVWANSPWKGSYASFLSSEIVIDAGPLHLALTTQEWINDGLMAVFFFVVGLEIKRELVKGELRDRRAATLPVLAAVGGMIVPAAIYLAFNAGTATAKGWGVPMATDIAFAVGVVSLLGRRVPAGLKVFLLTLAVADDIGVISVIAIFYSHSIHLGWLAGAAGVLAFAYGLRRLRVWYLPIYVGLGVVAWYLMLRSGVHATVAGVILGFLTPMVALRPDLDAEVVTDRLENRPELSAADVEAASFLIRESVPVGERLIDRLHPWTSFLVLPLFALANAGIPLTADALRSAASSSVTWGVAVGLVVGKTVGVLGVTWLAIRLGIARRPRGATDLHLLGIALAAGIGFTVALFVTGLAFDDPSIADEAKIGILGASVCAAVASGLVLRLAASRASPEELSTEALEDAELFSAGPDGP